MAKYKTDDTESMFEDIVNNLLVEFEGFKKDSTKKDEPWRWCF